MGKSISDGNTPSRIRRYTVGGSLFAALAAPFWFALGLAEEPASFGERAYEENCAACHGIDLAGAPPPNVGGPLKGPLFAAKWQKAQPAELESYIRQTMPLDRPGALGADTYAAITQYLWIANGFAASAIGPRSDAQSLALEQITDAQMQQLGEDDQARQARRRLDDLAGGLTTVNDELLREPPGQDWLAWRRTDATLGFSPLDQINRANVAALALAWSSSLGPGTNGIVPLVHDGVMFVNSNGIIRALDASNGDVIWSYERKAAKARRPVSQSRGMALYENALYVPTVDAHVLALDARTGTLLWDHEIADGEGPYQLTAAPLAVKGKIIQGVTGCQGADHPGGCFLVALDAKNGSERWRFNTIASPGDSSGDTWNGLPPDERFGGSVWTTGSYDPETDLVYFGTGQTYIVSGLLQGGGTGKRARDALYTNTTLALDPDTGHLDWYYQHVPGDVLDLDWAFERTLVTLPTASGSRRAVITSGKTGIIDALDARTGQYLWSLDMGLQSVITAIDPVTGRKTVDPALTPEVGKLKLICPSTLGARNWPATAYDPSAGVMFVPLSSNCMKFGLVKEPDEVTLRNFGEFDQVMAAVPNSDGNYGRIAAVDLARQKFVWTRNFRAAQPTAILATAGGIIFQGGNDRWFRALDSATGETLWQARLAATPNAFPITYSVGETQYVAIVSGGGTPVELFLRTYTPELRGPAAGKTLMVFALPQSKPSGDAVSAR